MYAEFQLLNANDEDVAENKLIQKSVKLTIAVNVHLAKNEELTYLYFINAQVFEAENDNSKPREFTNRDLSYTKLVKKIQ